MAEVRDSEEFVIKSKVCTGFKREFAFACNSHYEIETSLSKTQPRKNQNMVPPPEPKRTRISNLEDELKDNVVDTVTENSDDATKKMKKKNKRNKKKVSTRGKKSKVGSSKTKKFGSMLKDFLNSGILDGLHVKYSHGKTVLSNLLCCILYFLVLLQYEMRWVWLHDTSGQVLHPPPPHSFLGWSFRFHSPLPPPQRGLDFSVRPLVIFIKIIIKIIINIIK